MKLFSISLVLVVALLTNAFAGSFKVTRNASVFASVDKVTSQVGTLVFTVKPGEVLEATEGYAAYVEVQAKAGTGWAWYELFKDLGNDQLIPDPNKDGRDGIALLAVPNDLSTAKKGFAVFANETVKITKRWYTWITVKKDGKSGVIFIGEGEYTP